MEKKAELCRGKAKSVYFTDDEDHLIVHFRNDTSEFDGEKIEQLDRKGMINNKFTAFIMEQLEQAGIKTHHVKMLSDDEAWRKKFKMLPAE